MFENKQLQKETKEHIKKIEETITQLSLAIGYLKDKKELSEEIGARVAELELKMSKLWALLIDYTPRKQEKLSKFGKKFGGKSMLNSR